MTEEMCARFRMPACRAAGSKMAELLAALLACYWTLQPHPSHHRRGKQLTCVRMRSVARTGQSEKQLFRAGEIPTWQWLWSVFPALTWDGFSSLAARLNLVTPFVSTSPPRDRCDPNPALESSTCRQKNSTT